MAYRYTPAFVAFCKGAPVEEIAAEFNIPLKSLKAKIREEGWRTLVNRMGDQLVVEINPSGERLTKIEENRAQNYQTALQLSKHLELILEHLVAGTLKVKKRFQYKGQVTEYDAEPGSADLVSIATYARTIADMRYRALGDFGDKGYRADAPAGTPGPTPAIEIVLPSAIARPRSERSAANEPLLLNEKNN